MKKIMVLVASSVALFTFLTVNSFAEDTALKITAKTGKASIKLYSSDKWSDIAVGQVLHSKDMISTECCDLHSKKKEKKHVEAKGAKCSNCGNVTLEFPDKSSVSLTPNTQISIEDLVFDNASRKLKVNMSKGELRMMITKVNTPSDFSVQTPNAIYGATGTIFYVKATSAGTSVYVAEGSISVVNPLNGKTYTVTAGYVLTINADGTIDGPTLVSDVNIREWTAYYADPMAEPYTPPVPNNLNVTPPNDIPERAVSGN